MLGLDNPIHIAFLVVILLLVFGAKRLPEIGRSLGSGMREFKEAISGEVKQSTLSAAVQSPQQPSEQAPVPQPAVQQPSAQPAPQSTGAQPAPQPATAPPAATSETPTASQSR
jgi:sec-independent protein translocase protein TatA